MFHHGVVALSGGPPLVVVVESRSRGGDIWRSGELARTVSSEGLPAPLQAPSSPKETAPDFATLVTLAGQVTIGVSTDL